MSQRRYADGYRKLRRADAPRRVAFEVLSEVTSSGAFANIVLPKALRRIRREEPFDDRDAAFTSELVHGTLRARGRLDWALARHVDRPLGDLDPRVLDLLRMGAHQLLDMRVPDHAAVSATVDVAREHLTDGPVRMVNAVLRALAREEVGRIDEEIARIEDGDARLAVAHSHPEWMVRALRAALAAHGYDEAELEDALAADNEAPIVSLAARPGLIGVEELCEEAEDVLSARVATGLVSKCAVLLASGDPARLPSIRQGLAGVQDEGSQLAAQICAGAPLVGQGDSSWLDLCAGPGGKAALLGALAAGRGAHVVANEIHPHRARLVERADPDQIAMDRKGDAGAWSEIQFSKRCEQSLIRLDGLADADDPHGALGRVAHCELHGLARHLEARSGDRVAIGIDHRLVQQFRQAVLDAVAHHVLPAARLRVDRVPLQADDVEQQALGQAVLAQHLHRARPALPRQLEAPVPHHVQ